MTVCGAIDVERTSIRLKKAFAERNMKAADIRDALGLCTVQAVYKWFDPHYKTLPSIDNLVAISAVLGISIDDLIVRKGSAEEGKRAS